MDSLSPATATPALHPEDVRAALRKRHGTVAAFAIARDLKPQALADWLRGRTNATVNDVVAAELGIEDLRLTMNMDDSAAGSPAHRQNAGAR